MSYLQQYRSSWPQGQSITPSQMWFADIHLFSPQCKGDLETVFFARMGFFTILVLKAGEDEEGEEEAAHSPHPISSLWSSQSKWPSHRQSTGMHLVPSHWNPLVHTVYNTFTKKRVTSIIFFFLTYNVHWLSINFISLSSFFFLLSLYTVFPFHLLLEIFKLQHECEKRKKKKREKVRKIENGKMGSDSGLASIANPLYYRSFRSFSNVFEDRLILRIDEVSYK